jgi:predicted RNA-binding Zn-ribbon protein involved in translation (DUF1610 family)
LSLSSDCPNCGSEKTRRGGNAIWIVYLALVALAIPAVLVLHLNAAIVAGIMVAVVVIAHLVINQRVCVDCGHQWRSHESKTL